MQLLDAGKARRLQPDNQLLNNGETPVTVGLLIEIVRTALVDCPGNAVIQQAGLLGGLLFLVVELLS